LGYFGWQYFKKKKEETSSIDLDPLLEPKSTAISVDAANTIPPKPRGTPITSFSKSKDDPSGFPLKRGSKGTSVRLLQEALINKYGQSILPKFGADGSFGSELVNALKKAGLPATINQSTYHVLTEGTAQQDSLGKALFENTAAKNYAKALSLLKQMQSSQDYARANEEFKTHRINGVRQTIVNGLLSTFTNEAQLQAIRFEFLRMGLQFDGSKWSLSGLEGKAIITKKPTTVWVNATQCLQVPAHMILGNEVSRKLGYTSFENRGKYFLVNTQCIDYLE
jgi:hypothetical protein